MQEDSPARLQVVSPREAEPAPGPEPVSKESRAAAGPLERIPLEEGLAAAALAMDDWTAAARHCSRLVEGNPDHFEGWFNLGVARQRNGEWDDAVFAYRQASRVRPRDARPWVNLAIIRHAQGDKAAARTAYETALNLDPVQGTVLWNLALIVEGEGQTGEAEALLARLVGADPRQEQAWFRLGLLRGGREEWSVAAEAFERCLDLRNPWLEAALNYAVSLFHLERFPDARRAYEEILRLDPAQPQALRGLGAIVIECGDWERGVQIRRKLIEERQSLPELTYGLALVLEQNGRLEEAARLYCEALKERPRFPEALLNLGHVLNRIGRKQEATECWKRALALNHDYAKAYFESGL